MNSQEFVLWLKGLTEGVHEYNITPKQWDLLKERLAEVRDESKVEFPSSTPNPTPWTPPFNPYDPYNPYRITCDGTNPNIKVTTTPGTTGHITYVNPHLTTGTADPLRTAGYIAPVDQKIPPATITSGSSSTAVMYTFPGTTITYTSITGSGFGVGSTFTTTNTNQELLLDHKVPKKKKKRNFEEELELGGSE